MGQNPHPVFLWIFSGPLNYLLKNESAIDPFVLIFYDPHFLFYGVFFEKYLNSGWYKLKNFDIAANAWSTIGQRLLSGNILSHGKLSGHDDRKAGMVHGSWKSCHHFSASWQAYHGHDFDRWETTPKSGNSRRNIQRNQLAHYLRLAMTIFETYQHDSFPLLSS